MPLARTLALFALACLAACGSGTGAPRPLVVLAASSLQEALEAEAAAWHAQDHPQPTLAFAALKCAPGTRRRPLLVSTENAGIVTA